MPKLKGSKTERNLLTAFAGESQARNRYTFFASAAKNEGLQQISTIFDETANQEKEHAKRLFKLLEGGEVEVTASFPAGVIGSTLENLKESAAGEHHEHTEMYPDFAKVAREEGFEQVAKIQRPGGQHRGRHGLQAGEEGGVALPELRLPARGNGSTRGLPCMRACPGALRAAGRELVTNSQLGEEQPRPC